ncbi:BTB domain-containing protein [Caerostris darwini]|uniref:BTB domain-containing protein n=1 Tax=Caerostris darwini TaxID=1538125 RepID=A0AAV4WFG7_9ARAC|nr:BTB domain-containing protein [Caerostris darwini]
MENYDSHEVNLKFSIGSSENPKCVSYPETLQTHPATWKVDLKCLRTVTKKNVIGIEFDVLPMKGQISSVGVYLKLQIANYVQQQLMNRTWDLIFTRRSKEFNSQNLTFFIWLNNKILLSPQNEELDVEVFMKMKGRSADSVQTPIKKNKRMSDEYNRSILQQDFKQAFENRHYTDVTLKGMNGTVLAHKFVLCCRSSAFEKLIQQNTKEIDIPNLSKDDLDVFLEYLYTGTLGNVNVETIIALYETSVFYEVISLKSSCCEALVSQITLKNANKILTLARNYDDPLLQGEVIDFVCENIPYFKTLENKQFLASNILEFLEQTANVCNAENNSINSNRPFNE